MGTRSRVSPKPWLIIMLTAALALALVIAGGGATAQASPGGGATTSPEVIDLDFCTTIAVDPVSGHVIQLCLSVKGQTQLVVTPSGRTQFVSNIEVVSTVVNQTTGEVLSSDERRSHRVLHEKDGVLHVLHELSRGTVESGGTTCKYVAHFHLVNGEVQFDRFEVTCA